MRRISDEERIQAYFTETVYERAETMYNVVRGIMKWRGPDTRHTTQRKRLAAAKVTTDAPATDY